MGAAVLDTSVLWPGLQRDFLLSLAAEGSYRPKWSTAILDELVYHEAKKLVAFNEITSSLVAEQVKIISAVIPRVFLFESTHACMQVVNRDPGASHFRPSLHASPSNAPCLHFM